MTICVCTIIRQLLHKCAELLCHPSHSLFSLLPSGKRLRCLPGQSSRPKDRFCHQAVRRFNSLPALPPLRPATDSAPQTLPTPPASPSASNDIISCQPHSIPPPPNSELQARKVRGTEGAGRVPSVPRIRYAPDITHLLALQD